MKTSIHKTLVGALAWAEAFLRDGNPLQASRVWEDRFRKPPSRSIKLLGVEKKAETFIQRMAPNGHWTVEVEEPGSACERAGLFGPRTETVRLSRLSAWYSRFFPYAYGMMKAEHSFRCLGIDFESINSYYGTCMGFVDMGLGNEPGRFASEDVDLFNAVYSASNEVKTPDLPFMEAYWPCCAFVAAFKPNLIPLHCDQASYTVKHVSEVLRKIGRPVPDFKWRKNAA